MTDPPIADVPACWQVLSTTMRYAGSVFSVRTDRVAMQDGEVADRDVVRHPGAVAVVAIDGGERVLMVRQYRHPVSRLLWELPAGLRDVDGEPPLATAKRELLEETGYRASGWLTLVDFFTSPGMSNERIRIFLARGPTEVPMADRDFAPRHEEASMQVAWVPLEDAVRGIFAGHLHNPTAVVGILSAYAARSDGFATLRSADAPEG
ncbi:MAG TPA: NUDIX hydrolase [Streptosporangiaceae bacterium]|nr:NUDIX hydrolase [Streptosporangiaceae bacterium]